MIKWLKDFRRDFLTKEFIPLKILNFFMMGGMMTLFPFLTIQARSLGITGQELGIIYGVIPIVGLFAPSLAGLLADKVGNFKIILSLTVLLSGFASLLFLLIPPGRIVHTLPMQLPITINCTMDGAEITVAYPFSCDVNTKSNQSHTLEIQKCLYDCTNDVQQGHLVDEFLNQWCQTTESCQILSNVEVSIDIKSVNMKSKDPFDVHLIENEEGIRGSFSMNTSWPLEITPITGNETYLGISEIFCPNFEQIDTLQRECWMTCEAATETNSICNNTKSTEEVNPMLTFWLYLIIRVITGVTLAMSQPLFLGAMVAIIKEKKGDLGLQAVYANLGMIVLTPISGLLIDWVSKINNKEDYSPAFGLHCGIKCLCAFVLLFINLEFKQPSKRVLKDFRELITQAQVLTYLSFAILVGTCNGFVETFLFWLLEDLGADKSLMGTTVTVGAACGIPLLMMSSFIIAKLGHVNTLVVCSLTYVIRFAGYSLIKNPWLVMPFEALETFTNSLMAVTAISYAAILSKPSTVASLQGIFGGAYHAIGRGLGSLIGGILIKNVGSRAAFQIFALMSGVGGGLYFAVNKFVFKNNSVQEDAKPNYKKETKETNGPIDESLQNSNHVNIETGIENSLDITDELNYAEMDANSKSHPKAITNSNKHN